MNEYLYLSDSLSDDEGEESDQGEFDWCKDKNRCNVEDDEANSEILRILAESDKLRNQIN